MAPPPRPGRGLVWDDDVRSLLFYAVLWIGNPQHGFEINHLLVQNAVFWRTKYQHSVVVSGDDLHGQARLAHNA